MRSRPYTLPIILAFVAALLFFAFPNLVIQPYTRQNPTALSISLYMLRHLHAVELACLAITAVAVGTALLRRVSLTGWTIAAAAAVALCTIASYVDIYEILFHPIGKPSFQSQRDTRLDADERVLAINATPSRAYPIRTISYHHVVNDYVAGVPIAVTY